MKYYLARDADDDEQGYGLIEIDSTAPGRSALVMNKWGQAVNAILDPISKPEYETYAIMKIFPVLKPRFRGSMRYYVNSDTL
jgi:hypothetical protein